ncbi:MAG: DUF3160 domain-containing protein [Chloroflexi bacterium]|nr:DUF3160 domain-containing protein [Chloroflexota bacterium]
MVNYRYWRILLIFVVLLTLVASNLQQFASASSEQRPKRFSPRDAQYFDLIDGTFTLSPEEIALLEQNGVVMSDRLVFYSFSTAYAYIYWKDLPVLVTTDSILQAVHETYDDLLQNMERYVLMPRLRILLEQSLIKLRSQAAANTDSTMTPLYADMDTYFNTALMLLNDAPPDPNINRYHAMATEAAGIETIDLFGVKREIDFTLFKPRGHYTEDYYLGLYFRAITWLAQIDFRMVSFDPQTAMPTLNLEPLASAILLRQTIQEAEQQANWEAIDNLLKAFVGQSDNMTLNGLERLMSDVGLNSPTDALNYSNPDQLLTMLTTSDYGWQRISGQITWAYLGRTEAIPQPVTFMLLGSRYVIDSEIMSNLVFDRLYDEEGRQILRPYPKPLDVMYAIGNNRALTHLASELDLYGYQDSLEAARVNVNNMSTTDVDFWTSSFYNRWLTALRALNSPVTDEGFYADSMQTPAWADKMLHTQLASWTQLRHDNILYVKQSFTTGGLTCQYPTGYVEPYPAFYAAVADYARAGRSTFEQIASSDGVLSDYELENEQSTIATTLTYFNDLESAATQLQTLAEKELRLEQFTEDEDLFLRSIVIRQYRAQQICGVDPWEWNGWYMKLFPWQDDSPALVADVHTNINNNPQIPELLPPGVLHVGTGSVSTTMIVGNTDEVSTMYVGPTFTYYEFVEEGFPPMRLTDDDWRDRFGTAPLPTPPDWTSSFRLPVANPQGYNYLMLPQTPDQQ